jgi:tartrate dehydrogenase/decarboxylase/D-malate dehydrogenase
MKTHRIAVLAGDGIGKEVIPAGVEVLNAVATYGGFKLDFTQFPWGCDFYLRHGRMMDADAVDQLRTFDAIYLGAIGDPKVPDHISAGELLLPLRRRLVQYVNLRPVRLLPGIASPLAGRGAADIDIVCVRENSEGEYCGVGGRVHTGTPDELAERHIHAPRDRTDRPLRVHDGRIASAKAAGERDEIKCAPAFDDALG